MTKYIKSLKGVTLIELIIVIVILGTVLTMVTTMIIQAFNIVNPSSERMSAKQLAEMHVTEIARYVRNSEYDNIEFLKDQNKIKINSDSGEITFNSIKYFNITSSSGDYGTEDEPISDTKVFNNKIKSDIYVRGSLVLQNGAEIKKTNIMTIELEKCLNNNCEDSVIVKRKVSSRGSSNNNSGNVYVHGSLHIHSGAIVEGDVYITESSDLDNNGTIKGNIISDWEGF